MVIARATSEVVFCKEIIERVSEMKLLDFEYKYIFEPLNMSQTKRGRAVNTNTYSTYRNKELLKVEIDEAASDLFTTTVNDVEKLDDQEVLDNDKSGSECFK